MPTVRKSAYRLLVLSAFLLLNRVFVYAQTEAPFKMEPVGEEAFQVLHQFFQYDQGIPLEARIVEKQDNPNHVREKIVFRGVRDSRVPGYLAIPKTGAPPYPCVLQLHGLTGSKSDWWQDDGYISGGRVTKGLLEAGFAVLALDAQYHGERISNNDYESAGVMIFQQGWFNRSREMMVQSTVEYRRAIDYLNTRTEIDTTRIGVIGYSMGGMMTFSLTGVEPRIKVSVACVTPTIKDRFGATAPHNFAAAVDGRPFLMVMGRSDPYYVVEEAQQLHSLIDSPTKELVFYDSDHRLPVEYTGKAVAWFQNHLK